MFVTLKRLNQEGDTIVEVLISIAIISLILGGAFILTNRSLQGTRSAQERLNGISLVGSQLEQVKNLAAANANAVFGATVPSPFCINSSGAVVASSSATCNMDTTGAPTTKEPVFSVSVTRTGGNTFTAKAIWNSVTGTGQNNVQMVYKVYP